MEILDLFEEEGMRWTPERMMQRLRVPRSTLYRYLKVLTDAGLVTSLPDVGYSLGPRIAELDYEMRSSDPLIVDGRPLLQALVAEVPGVGLLCRHYRGRVLCVHQEGVTREFRSSYERGRAMPLAQGAASRAILAYLKPAQLRRVLLALSGRRNQLEMNEALQRIRRDGYCVTRAELTRGVIGIAAPIFDRRNNVLGSLSITIGADHVSEKRTAEIALRVINGAQTVTRTIARTATPQIETPRLRP